MRLRKLLAALLVVFSLAGAGACGDDAGEDRLGDNEINDEGD